MKTFTDIWVSMNPKQKQRLAEKVGSSKAYLSQIAHGYRGAGRKMIRKLIAADHRIRVDMFL